MPHSIGLLRRALNANLASFLILQANSANNAHQIVHHAKWIISHKNLPLSGEQYQANKFR